MTYKYILVRSDVFEKCNEKSFHKKRSFSDMRKLFTIKYWVLFILLLAICITAIVLFFCLQNKAYSFIPWIFIPIILSIEERYREKLFNPEARRKELLEKANGYKDYLENIENVLSSHGITSANYGVLRKESLINTSGTNSFDNRCSVIEFISRKPVNILDAVSAIVCPRAFRDVIDIKDIMDQLEQGGVKFQYYYPFGGGPTQYIGSITERSYEFYEAQELVHNLKG